MEATRERDGGTLRSGRASELAEHETIIADAVESFTFQFLKGHEGLTICNVAKLLKSLSAMDAIKAQTLVNELLDQITE